MDSQNGDPLVGSRTESLCRDCIVAWPPATALVGLVVSRGNFCSSKPVGLQDVEFFG